MDLQWIRHGLTASWPTLVFGSKAELRSREAYDFMARDCQSVSAVGGYDMARSRSRCILREIPSSSHAAWRLRMLSILR